MDGLPLSGAPLRRVVTYRWITPEGQEIAFCDAAEYWIGTDKTTNTIIVAPEYAGFYCPNVQVLECGHEKPVPMRGQRSFFCRSRRCLECALESL